MGLYNIEIFDRTFRFIYANRVEDDFEIDDDYLSPGSTEFSVPWTDKIQKGYYCRVFNQNVDYTAIVDSVNNSNDYIAQVGIKPFVHIFNHEVRFDTKHMKSSLSLESEIQDLINVYWISTRDDDPIQEFANVTISRTSSTTKWFFDIEPANDEIQYNFVNFYEEILIPALTKYGVAISVNVNWKTKKINLKIGKGVSGFTIDSDLDNVAVETFDIKSRSSEVNKLEIWNSKTYAGTPIYYYLYENGTYGTNKSGNRISPVVLQLGQASEESETENGKETITKTFAQAAKEYADDVFGEIDIVDNIELSVLLDDALIKPMEHNYGDIIYVIYRGVRYKSVLTGRKIGSNVTLMFGNVRHDYTKKIRLQKLSK